MTSSPPPGWRSLNTKAGTPRLRPDPCRLTARNESGVRKGATGRTTKATPVLLMSTSAKSDINISCVRWGVLGAAAFPSNASIVFSVNTVTGTKAGGNAVTPLQLSGIAKASLLTAVSTAGGNSEAALKGLSASEAPRGHAGAVSPGHAWGGRKTPGVVRTKHISWHLPP